MVRRLIPVRCFNSFDFLDFTLKLVMPRVQGFDRLVSLKPRKRFGRPREFGRSMFGFSVFGDSDVYLSPCPFGAALFGDALFGDIMIFSGIFRKNTNAGPKIFNREPYYIPKNPRTDPQQTQRGKMTSGVAAWKALTPPEKEEYNVRAKGFNLSGYNLFLREYLSSS